jgi:hypothetical protein
MDCQYLGYRTLNGVMTDVVEIIWEEMIMG